MWIIKGVEDDVRVCRTTKNLRAAWSDLSDWTSQAQLMGGWSYAEEADTQALVIPGGAEMTWMPCTEWQ